MALEKELLNGINLMREGREEGFNILYSHSYNFVYGRARMIMKNEEDALDLTQETFIQAYKGIHSLENPENIYAWLGSIAYRQGMKLFRKKQEVLVDEEAEGIFENIVSADKDTQPEESAEAKATSRIIMDLVEELPELQRAAVVAFYYDNMKIDDIAKAFECSSNTIKSRLNYAKKFLKTKVEEHQRENNYRLCSFSPALLLMALRAMFATEKYTLTALAAEGVYSGACGALGLVASAGVTGVAGVSGVAGAGVDGTGTVGVAAASASAGAGAATAAGTAVKGAGAFAKLAAGWTAKKTAIAIALSTVSIATAVVVPQLTKPEAPPVVEMAVPTDTPTPTPTNTPTPTPHVEPDGTTAADETVILTSTRQEIIDGIKQAAEAFEQGQNIIVRSDNAELKANKKKSISVLYRWLIEEGLHYNVYSEEGDGYVDFHIHWGGSNIVIPAKTAEEVPVRIKEYLDGLENPDGVRFDIWCLDDKFSLSNDDLQLYLDDNRYLCEYDVHFGSRRMSRQDLYEGIHILTDGWVRETNRVYSTEELAEYIKAKENENPGMLAVLNVYFHADYICEANYQEIIKTMCEKEGIRVRYAKYVREGVVYLDF